MRQEPTSEEKFAFELVKSVLDVEIDSTGEQRFPGHVDAILRYSSGGEAALEVSILGDQDEIELWKLLKKNDYLHLLAGSLLWWNVRVSPRVRWKEFERHWEKALRLYEACGVTSLENRFPQEVLERSPALQWFEKYDISVYGFANTTNDPANKGRQPGEVRVMVEGHAGFVGDADIVPIWLTEQAAADSQIKRKLDKLAASGFLEQHPFSRCARLHAAV